MLLSASFSSNSNSMQLSSRVSGIGAGGGACMCVYKMNGVHSCKQFWENQQVTNKWPLFKWPLLMWEETQISVLVSVNP